MLFFPNSEFLNYNSIMSRDGAAIRGSILSSRQAIMNEPDAYDPLTSLLDQDGVVYFLADAFATEDAGRISHAMGTVARARGMGRIATQTGLSREQLYRTLSGEGNPTLRTLLTVLKALGVSLSVRVAR